MASSMHLAEIEHTTNRQIDEVAFISKTEASS